MNTQIEIKENGTTTLATAGKYCDRNIDVNVDVPSNDAELAEQKAITGSILDRSITEFTSNTLTKIGANAFSYCQLLHTVNCPKVSSLAAGCFMYCSALQRIEFFFVDDIYGNAFSYCSKLDTLIIRYNGICKLRATSAFNNTPIKDGTGYIYVPDDLVDTYKTTTNWTAYANQIKPISELEE